MGYRTLRQCLDDLESDGRLARVADEVDANLEIAEIHRRVYRSGGPAILFENVKGCQFPVVSNLFGTIDRARFLFRDTLDSVARLIELRTDASRFWKQPLRYWRAPLSALRMLPRWKYRSPVRAHATQINQLPQIRSWPNDGGAFITLGQVYSEDAERPGLLHSNLGMYRVQISGGEYAPNREIGLHYQIHRGIGVHHAAAIRRQVPFRVNVFVGGTPAMSLAAVMPLPEGMSELTFAGVLAGHRIGMFRNSRDELPEYAEADFCIRGTVDAARMLPEGPFGDHLGYYSLTHDFPVLRVDSVTHRPGAIWPMTVVGRPPQEDTVFGELIHELTGPVIPTVVRGVQAVHAVDAAGVHPLLLAIGSERYTPYSPGKQPQELLTQANAILGQGQLSLAKYLLIVDRDDDPSLEIHEIGAFLRHLLQRVDTARDLHFQTCTTIDTLDYSGSGLNQGSKVVIAAAGPPRRELATQLDGDLRLPEGFSEPRVAFPGVLAVRGPQHAGQDDRSIQRWVEGAPSDERGIPPFPGFPLVVVVDDAEFVAQSLGNFLWVVFTRSNPAADIDGFGSFVERKHWGCRGSLVIDARIKPHHAPPLVEDLATSRKVDAMAARGGVLARWL